jgi:hypothetical protein
VLFLGECGKHFGMPQVQLPIFPAGVTPINSEVAFEERDGKIYYFNGHLPVFVHEKSALATFRLFSTQLVINGNATQAALPAGRSSGLFCPCQEALGQQIDGASVPAGARAVRPRAASARSGPAAGDIA